jgi:regulator of sigma E protease
MNVFAALFTVAALVFIHESGHFLVAKACGIQVKVFSFGFGRRLFGFEAGGTDYRVSLLPFGGYVQMAGADPFGTDESGEDELDDPSRGFMRKPVWQRLLVVAAGPAFNLILPVVVFTGLYMLGEPQPAPVIGGIVAGSPASNTSLEAGDRVSDLNGSAVETWEDLSVSLSKLPVGQHQLHVVRDGHTVPVDIELTVPVAGAVAYGLDHQRPAAMVGVDDPRSPAGAAGLRTGDLLVSINGQPIVDWVDALRLLGTDDAQAAVEVDREGERVRATLHRAADWAPLSGAGGSAGLWGLLPATLFVADVGETAAGGDDFFSGCSPGPPPEPSPAMVAGFQKGDRFLRLDGADVTDWGDVLEGVRGSMEGEGDAAGARALDVELVRDGKVMAVHLTPQVIRDTDAQGRYYYRPVLGVTRMGELVAGPTTRRYYNFPDALSRGTRETAFLAGFIVEQLGKLLTGEAAVRKSLGGPVEIVRQATIAAEEGLFTMARMMGMLSISLGIINLLPVPVLDGGQLLFYTIEGIRGRPVPQALRERAQQLGVLFLVVLMLSVLVFDVHRLFEGS